MYSVRPEAPRTLPRLRPTPVFATALLQGICQRLLCMAAKLVEFDKTRRKVCERNRVMRENPSDFQQLCPKKCGNRRRCLSMQACSRVKPPVPSSPKKGSLGPGLRVCTNRGCVLSLPTVAWTRASAAVLDEVIGKSICNTIVALPIEEDNFAKKYLSSLVRHYGAISQFFKRLQDS
jgi:hypothetical protein